ncbi:MAG: sulfatase-like hydrolase/transferase, partial [Lachnospiraceae bacterium]|nr:sulfatase-like hydrolase/transferase [Lachnospiraceae bacterium]
MYFSPDAVGLTVGVLLIFHLLSGLYENVYISAKIDRNDSWTQDAKKITNQGYPAFLYFSYLRAKDLFPKEPQGYGNEMVEGILKDYKSAESDSTNGAYSFDEKPDVVYLMLESIMDPDLYEEKGVVFSENPDPFMDEYALSQTVSPTMGGLTSRAEFEALTGLSDSWYPSGTVEYTTFFGGSPRDTYSVVNAFEDHGYKTVAIHQNTGAFFNRNVVYNSFGFDRFVTINDFEERDKYRCKDGFMKCDHFLGLIENELEDAGYTEDPENDHDPQEGASQHFIWGITIESHGPFADKYESTDIKAQCDSLTGDQIKELEGYIQSLNNTDKMLSDL